MSFACLTFDIWYHLSTVCKLWYKMLHKTQFTDELIFNIAQSKKHANTNIIKKLKLISPQFEVGDWASKRYVEYDMLKYIGCFQNLKFLHLVDFCWNAIIPNWSSQLTHVHIESGNFYQNDFDYICNIQTLISLQFSSIKNLVRSSYMKMLSHLHFLTTLHFANCVFDVDVHSIVCKKLEIFVVLNCSISYKFIQNIKAPNLINLITDNFNSLDYALQLFPNLELFNFRKSNKKNL